MIRAIPILLALIVATIFTSPAAGQSGKMFHGYTCSNDCSAHEIGYVWASTHAIYAQGDCPQKTKSFYEGCSAYALETRQAIAKSNRPAVLTRFIPPPGYCHSNSHKCQAVCDASNRLDSASSDLAVCASRHDYSDSCDMQFNDVRDAHDALESAVSEASGDCD